jgi:hypothetical protein
MQNHLDQTALLTDFSNLREGITQIAQQLETAQFRS